MIAETLLPEFDQEYATTRKHLERVTADRFDWAPHDKSMSLGRLASHLAEIPQWALTTVNDAEFDVAPAGAEPYQSPVYKTSEELLAAFDKSVSTARDAIAGASDELLMNTWTLKNGGEALFTMPKVAVLKAFVINHAIHHRGQLSVYLRMCDLPVPQTYGPTADEGAM